LRLAERIQKIIKDRLSILVMEFLQVARETVEAKKKSLADFGEAYKALSVAYGYHGTIALEKELVATEREMRIIAGLRNIAVVRIPLWSSPVEEETLPAL